MSIVVIFDFFHEPLKPVLITFAPLWRLTNIASSSAKINPYFRSFFMTEMMILVPSELLLSQLVASLPIAIGTCTSGISMQHFLIANTSSAYLLIRKSAHQQLFTIYN